MSKVEAYNMICIANFSNKIDIKLTYKHTHTHTKVNEYLFSGKAAIYDLRQHNLI